MYRIVNCLKRPSEKSVSQAKISVLDLFQEGMVSLDRMLVMSPSRDVGKGIYSIIETRLGAG